MKSLLRIYFVILLLNILIVSCIFFTKFQNIARSNVQSANYNSAVTYVNAFLIISQVFIGIQILLLLLGLPFAKEPFAIQILFQLLGVVCFGMFVLFRMPYQTIGYIWGVFCLIPFVFAISSLIYRSVGYKKYQILNYIDDNSKQVLKKQVS